jgi:hypothetical protein
MKEHQIINEVPVEEEENESQDVMGSRMQQSSDKRKVTYPNSQQPEEDSAARNPEEETEEAEQPTDGMVELTEEQLVELLQNADKLTPEQQAQLQLILKDRWKQEVKNQKQLQYDNIYNILTENVAKAKVRMANLGDSPKRKNTGRVEEDDVDTMERILKQKREYETLLKAYNMEQKSRTRTKEME